MFNKDNKIGHSSVSHSSNGITSHNSSLRHSSISHSSN